jgi:hypothetical protein
MTARQVIPSKAAQPFCTPYPTFCAVCGNPAAALGYTPINKWLDQLGPIMWLCTSGRCHGAARDLYFADMIAEREAGEGQAA